MINIDELKFDDNGLIPAVVTDAYTKKVLTLAYMNRESLEISIKEGKTCFFSRSRQKLWRKGETSTVEVVKDGPACHTGADSCFFNTVYQSGQLSSFSVDGLYSLLENRRENPSEGSYTSYLFEKGLDKILKKVGEECTEVIIAGKAQDKAETVYEIADLAYHVLVLMVQAGISVEDVRRELAGRHVINKKVKQEKMASDKM